MAYARIQETAPGDGEETEDVKTHLTVGGLCSGIGGFSLAFKRAGFSIEWECELNVAARSVLNRHFSEAHVYEDMTEFNPTVLDSVDILCGGTPCQGFSVAGLRNSLSDERSNLALRFVQLANQLNPEVALWENVPGVLNTRDNAFGCFLAGLVGADAPLVPPKECVGRWTNAGMADGPKRSAAWRVLDAQFFGLAQRRNRVFVVSSPRKNLPFEIFFERKSLCRDSPPRRTPSERIAPTLEGRSGSNGGNNFATSGGLVDVADPCAAHHSRHDLDNDTFVTHTLRSEGCDASEDAHAPTVAFTQRVRRLTPVECLRLMGLPDDWLDGLNLSDSEKYRMVGNAVAVPVVEWIARRLLQQLTS